MWEQTSEVELLLNGCGNYGDREMDPHAVWTVKFQAFTIKEKKPTKLCPGHTVLTLTQSSGFGSETYGPPYCEGGKKHLILLILRGHFIFNCT